MGSLAHEILRRMGYLFYVVDPRDTVFETVPEVPNYINEVIPLFIGFIFLEGLVAGVKIRKRAAHKINDAFGSLSQGIVSELFKFFTHGVLVSGYVSVHQNWRLLDLAWDSPWVWLLGLLSVDFIYYWLHRASHEVNIFWAAHQAHHSSEYYNLTTALRQSTMQSITNMLFYFPLAMIVPPTIFLVHNQFNLLYQFWIHTELVNKLGPLEYILNTPSHHRVHHGRNRYCIDANYAGMLIVWDRMFGTFQSEAEEVVYGLTHPINTFDPAQIQLGHYIHIWKTLLVTPGVGNKLSVLFKGPGWAPGKPRLGDPLEIPDAHAPAVQYNPVLPTWMTAYVVLHFFLILVGYLELTFTYSESVFQVNAISAIVVILLSLTSIGAILDERWYGPVLELCRCLLLVSTESLLGLFVIRSREPTDFFPQTLLTIVRACYGSSALLWAGYLATKPASFRIDVKNNN